MNRITVNHFNPSTPAWQIGLTAKEGGIIVVDTPLDVFFKGLHVGTGGDLVVLGMDGNFIPYKGLLNGSWVFVAGYGVVSSGLGVTTTAANITWIGGE